MKLKLLLFLFSLIILSCNKDDGNVKESPDEINDMIKKL